MDFTTCMLLLAAVISVALAAYAWRPIKPIQYVEHVEVKPEDAFIVSTERALSCEQREEIARLVERFRSGEAKTLVLDAGFSITVVSQ